MGATKVSPTSLADALFSKTQQRVLGAVFGQPDRSFYASALIEQIGGGSGAVQRELARLEATGLISATRIGNQKHYQANRDAPIFEELKRLVQRLSAQTAPLLGSPLMLKAAEPAAPAYTVKPYRHVPLSRMLRRAGVSRQRLGSFCRKRGIRSLSFFGSVTRDDFRPDSDIDVKVELEPDAMPGLFEIADLKGELSRLFRGRSVDVLTNPVISNPIRRQSIERDLTVAYAAG